MPAGTLAGIIRHQVLRVVRWKHDAMAFDLEAGCAPLPYGDNQTPAPWWPWAVTGSELEHKIRDPASCDRIGYSMRPQSQTPAFIARFVGFLVYCMVLAVLVPCLTRMGIDLIPASSDPETKRKSGMNGVASVWAEVLVTTGVVFLLAHGLMGTRAARERMERVRQTSVTLAYSFLKTATTDCAIGHDKDQLQVVIYECLCLLTAYPVALLEQIRGNTCEPGLPKYCRQTAEALQRLRNGDGIDARQRTYESKRRPNKSRGQHQFASVAFFFEIFSLELQLEFATQTIRVDAPSTLPHHIIYNLRNHFENLSDIGNIDDRRAPIIRESIDILAQSGRECTVFAFTDAIPLECMWFVYVAGWLIALYAPLHHCNWFVQRTPTELEATENQPLPAVAILAVMAALSVLCSMLTTILSQMWRLWDPFGRGTNTYGWTLGIAMEIDDMLNEFDEYDAKEILRKHSYMDSSAYLTDMKYGSGPTTPGLYVETV